MSSLSIASPKEIAVCYLARGGRPGALQQFRRFVASYERFDAGIEHDLFVIFKGFSDSSEMDLARDEFRMVPFEEVHTDDLNFDLGAYRVAAETIDNPTICFLNTNSEINGEYWLNKLQSVFHQPNVGMVSATGSYESLWQLDRRIPRFPNVHIRSNAFLLRREHAVELLPQTVENKYAAFMTESGPRSITRRIFEMGYSIRIVGRNGRGYAPAQWATSETFRQGRQENLLVHDNVTRTFSEMARPEKEVIIDRTWGEYFQGSQLGLIPFQELK